MSPLKSFICPDGEIRLVSECLEKCPLPEGRCLSLGHLTFIGGSDRLWKGKPSVTQLLKGTRQAYLEITRDYAVDPDKRAFAMYGSLLHKRLEIVNEKLEGLAEHTIISEISGTLDKLEPDELNEGSFKLIDYKLVGAYAVAKALGLKSRDGSPDMWEWEYQLNKYRVLLEESDLCDLFPVSRIFIQATMRDGNLRSTKDLGIERNMPLIPVRKIDNDVINDYFERKAEALLDSLYRDVMPPLCSSQESWNSRKCKGYCDVAMFCPEGAKINKVELAK